MFIFDQNMSKGPKKFSIPRNFGVFQKIQQQPNMKTIKDRNKIQAGNYYYNMIKGDLI